MSSSEITESTADRVTEPDAFGTALLKARQAKGQTVADVSHATHLAVAIIHALEASAIERLPPSAFVQGYLRIYARHLGIDEAPLISDYKRALPRQMEVELQPRSNLPAQTTSSTPLIRSVSIVLIMLGVLAMIYAVYDYYARTANNYDQEKTLQLNSTELDVPERMAEGIEQHAVMSDDGELIVVAPESADDSTQNISSNADSFGNEVSPAMSALAVTASNASTATAVVGDAPDGAAVANQSIELYVHADSWIAIVDDNGNRLYYDTGRADNSISLQGVPPFSFFLGNAPGVNVAIDGLEVKFNTYIRRNNTARFNVSINDRQVVFH